MGILGSKSNFVKYQISGVEITAEGLIQQKFVSIDDTPDEESMGWVQYDDMDKFDIKAIGEYLPFALRIDTRKVPAAALKAKIKKAHEKFLAENPSLRRVPKNKREEIKENLISSMLSKIPASPSTIEAVLHKDILYVFNASSSSLAKFEDKLRRTFNNISCRFITPYQRACKLVGESDMQNLNQADNESFESDTENNNWIGKNFFLWLARRTDDGLSDQYFIDGKITMASETKAISLTGENQFEIVKTALKGNKEITGVTLNMIHDENEYRVVLDAKTMAFRGFKKPSVTAEIDYEQDGNSSLFLESMYLLHKGEELFDNIFKEYLTVQTNETAWTKLLRETRQWFEEE